MSFSEMLNERRGGANAIFHKFRTSVKEGNELHLFVEGYDDTLFYERLLADLRGLFGQEWNTYNCLGKGNMDRVHQLFRDSAFTQRNVLFLRDSDFDRFLGIRTPSEKMFLTCGYSVENYVCTRESITRFIRAGFGVDAAEVDIPALVASHSGRVEQLFGWMASVIGAALYAVRAGRQLDLNKLGIAAYYTRLAADDLPQEMEAETWEKAGIQPGDFSAESAELGHQFVQQDAMRWLRGKYLLECTSVFLAELRATLATRYREGEITRFRRATGDISPSALFERLCPFASGSPELREALSRGVEVAA
jgi:hypothetical protein